MRRLLSLLPLLILPIFGAAQHAANSLLWEVSGKNLTSPSYIFGTIHLLCPEDVVWTPAMANGLKSAKTICMELDLDDPVTIQKMMAGLRDTGSGKSLRESLSAKDYQRFQRFAKDSAGIDILGLEGMDPATIPLLFVSKLMPCDAPASYEARIAMEAVAGKKQIEGLESVDEQLALVTKLSNDSGTTELLQLVDSFSALRRQFADMVQLYRAQDLDGLSAMIENSPILGTQTDALLGDRNRRWIPRLEAFMAAGPVFTAVGAGHLPGKNGVLELLRIAGYTVKPVR